MNPSPRNVVLQTLRKLAEEVRVGDDAYFVKRGWINWPTFFRDGGPRRGWSIMMPEGPLPGAPALRDFGARVEFEIFVQIPPADANPQIDDGVIDELVDDAARVLDRFEAAEDSRGDHVALRIDRRAARVQESHDPDVRVQGIVVQFVVGY